MNLLLVLNIYTLLTGTLATACSYLKRKKNEKKYQDFICNVQGLDVMCIVNDFRAKTELKLA